jgi:hypothetical protein
LSSQSQIASIDPGNVPGGLFWTLPSPLPSDSVEIDLGSGTAKYALKNVETLDFHDFVNDLQHGPSVPVTISFNVRWSGKKRNFQLRDAATGFRGEFVDTGATMEWTVIEGSSVFVSAAAATSSSVSAVLGQEHNGVFF